MASLSSDWTPSMPSRNVPSIRCAIALLAHRASWQIRTEALAKADNGDGRAKLGAEAN
jgi:hypothetical protein